MTRFFDLSYTMFTQRSHKNASNRPTRERTFRKRTKELTDIEFGSKKGNPETISLFDE